MDLERIVNILVDNAEELRHASKIDMSMFPQEQVPIIYAKAAEGTFQKRDFETTGRYLYLGQQWEQLLQWGVYLYHSGSDKEKKAGKNFLEILMCHNKLPEEISIELANDILAHEGEYSRFRAAMALDAGRAVTRAEEVANQFLNEGRYSDGTKFLAVAGKKLSDKQVKKYSEIALEKGMYKDAFEFYEQQKLPIPHNRAKVIAIDGKESWLFNRVVKYMDETQHSFTPKDFKEFGDKFFEEGNQWEALNIYERAGDTIQPQEYKTKGEQILAQSRAIESTRNAWSHGQPLPSIKLAFDYLSRYNLEEAKQRIAKFANNLLEEGDFVRFDHNFSQFGILYEMIDLPLPVDKALIAAQIAENNKAYDEAAKYYVAAGMKDAARKMGDIAIRSDNNWQKTYGARNCFELAGDEEGLAIISFLEKNTRRD